MSPRMLPKIIQESEEHIRKSTGFDVKVVEKRHTHVLEAIKQKAKSSATGEPDEFPDALKKTWKLYSFFSLAFSCFQEGPSEKD